MSPGQPSTLDWVLICPVKRLDRAKSRLSTRPAAQRRDLALAFAIDTVSMALRTPGVARVVVATDDAHVATAVMALGAEVVSDPPTEGLNEAVVHAVAVVGDEGGAAPIAVLAGDLPALTTEELDTALRAASAVERGFVADANGTGTTLLAAAPGVVLAPEFGPRSHAAHARSGAVALEIGTVPGLRRDVDTEVDLWDAVRLGVGPATRAALDRIADANA